MGERGDIKKGRILLTEYAIKNEAEWPVIAQAFLPLIQPGSAIYLQGELGAGKTCFTRAILKALGVTGLIKSPTFTLVETYALGPMTYHHFDLYRLKQPAELLEIGILDYFTDTTVCFIEWPEKGEAYLPVAQLTCHIRIEKTGRRLIIQGA